MRRIGGMSTATLPAPALATVALPVDLPMILPTADEAASLDREGFVIVRGLFDAGWRAQIAARLDELVAAEGDRAGLEVHQEGGTDRLANLVDKGAVFDGVWAHPRLLGLVAHVLRRPFSLSSLNAREPKAGQGHQGLHADWGGPRHEGVYHVAIGLVVLDGMDAGNGGTRVVPRSHLHADPIPDPNPEEIVVCAEPGDLVFLNSHTRHGGTVNRDGRRRRVLHPYYTAAEDPQQTDFARLVSPATRARLPSGARTLLRLPA